MCFETPIEQQITRELQQAIGLLFVTCGAVEVALGILLAKLAVYPAPLKSHTAYVTNGMDLKVKLMNIETCVSELFPENIAIIRKLTSSIRRQFDHRNAIAHNLSIARGDRLVVMVFKMTSKGPSVSKEFTSAQITSFSRILFDRSKSLEAKLTGIGLPKWTPDVAPQQ